MQLQFWDMIVFAAYIFLSFSIGCFFVIRSRDPEGFTSAKGRIPTLVVGLSLFGTYISSISFLGYAGFAFSKNWNTFTMSLTLLPSVWIAARWFIPFFRQYGDISTYSHLENRFGIWCRVYAASCYLLTQIARMGAVMYLLALPVHHLFGWNMTAIIVVTGLMTIVYSTLGGIEGVAWTDAMQAIILIGATIFCVLYIPFFMPEGPKQIFEIAAEHHKFSLGSFSLSLTESTFWVALVYGMTINLQNFGIDQNFVQRYMTARSEKEAKKSLWFSGIITIPINALFFFIGTALFACFTVRPELLSPELAAEIAQGHGDGVFPYFIVHCLPQGLSGLVIAAVFAAAMSTLSTSMNGSATLILTDIYRRFFRPQASNREQMTVLYSGSVLWGIFGILVALAMTRAKNILDVWWTVSGIVSGGMLGLFLLGFLSKKTKNASAVTGTIAGIAVILWMTLSLPNVGLLPDCCRNIASPFHSYLIPVAGTLTILMTGFLAAPLFRKRSLKKIESNK